MYQNIQELIQWQSDLLLAGRFEDLSREYDYPVALYLKSSSLPIRDSEHLIAILKLTRQSLIRRGVTKIVAKVIAMDLPRKGRFRVWVDSVEQNACGQTLFRAGSVLFCRIGRQGIRTEMVQFWQCAMPEIWQKTPQAIASNG